MGGPNGTASSLKMSPKEAAEDELSDLLSQPKEILIQIVNHLDAKSLQNLAFTSKSLSDFCQKTKGIKIVLEVNSVNLKMDKDNNLKFKLGWPYNGECFKKYLAKLRKWPISLKINGFGFSEMTISWEEADFEVKEYFRRNGVKSIRNLESAPFPTTAEEVGYFMEFVKIFGIESVDITCNREKKPSVDAFLACLQLPVNELWMYDTDFEYGDIDSVLKCSIPKLFVDSWIGMEEFERICEMWQTRSDLESWKFGYHPGFKILRFFDDWDIRTFTYTGPIDSNRPTVFMEIEGAEYHDERNPISFFIRRQDGRILRVVLDPPETGVCCVEFSICPVDEAPPALQSL